MIADPSTISLANPPMNITSSNGFQGFLAVVTTAFAVATFIFWMIVAWRAMRAHERIATTLEDHLPR